MYEKLRQWRLARSKIERVSPYSIAYNKHLVHMILIEEKSISELAKIKGFGLERAHKYGDDILNILKLLTN